MQRLGVRSLWEHSTSVFVVTVKLNDEYWFSNRTAQVGRFHVDLCRFQKLNVNLIVSKLCDDKS